MMLQSIALANMYCERTKHVCKNIWFWLVGSGPSNSGTDVGCSVPNAKSACSCSADKASRAELGRIWVGLHVKTDHIVQ